MVYTSTGQPAEYDQMSVTLFVSGILIVMAMDNKSTRPFMLQYLQEPMEDRELYGWEPIQTMDPTTGAGQSYFRQ